MAEATPPTLTIDYEKLGAAVAKAQAPALAAALAEANKPLSEALAKLMPANPAPNQATPAAGAGTAPLTAQDVSKIVADSLKGFQASQQQTQARDSYIADKLKDLPAPYRGQLGSDPSKWAAEEQAIREAYKADFKAAGGTVEDVSGSPRGGQAASAAINPALDKRTPQQLILDGLKEAQTAGPNATTSRGTGAQP